MRKWWNSECNASFGHENFTFNLFWYWILVDIPHIFPSLFPINSKKFNFEIHLKISHIGFSGEVISITFYGFPTDDGITRGKQKIQHELE